LNFVNSFKLTQHHLFYKGLLKFKDDQRLFTIFSISLLKPEISYYKNGVLINPTKLLLVNADSVAPKEVCRIQRHESEDSDDDFIFGTVEVDNIDTQVQDVDPFVARNIPTCHFVKPSESENIFLRFDKSKTCFLMIKSHQFYDVQVALKAGVWSSTAIGNKVLESVYQEYVVNRGGNVYLFFSVNKSGHICAFAELVSSKISDVPDIWLEKQKYTGCFLVRFILVKSIPMNSFSHLKNCEGLPIRRCRDTDMIDFEEGMFMAKTCLDLYPTSSILLDNEQVDFKYIQYEAQNQYFPAEKAKSMEDEKEAKLQADDMQSKRSMITPTKTSKFEESKSDSSGKKTQGKLNSASKAYSPFKAVKSHIGLECLTFEDKAQVKKFFKCFRSCDSVDPSGENNVFGSSVFSFGYYSNRDYFGLYSG
jgi:hypothetical protein